MYVKIVKGDLLKSKDDLIAHQCNCVSKSASTLAGAIFAKYPYANSYSKRVGGSRSVPGTIEIFGDGEGQRYVVNLYAQVYATNPRGDDTFQMRQKWFSECLDELLTVSNIQELTIGMPYRIGCGAAGGDWNAYYRIIKEFADTNKVHINLYKLTD